MMLIGNRLRKVDRSGWHFEEVLQTRCRGEDCVIFPGTPKELTLTAQGTAKCDEVFDYIVKGGDRSQVLHGSISTLGVDVIPENSQLCATGSDKMFRMENNAQKFSITVYEHGRRVFEAKYPEIDVYGVCSKEACQVFYHGSELLMTRANCAQIVHKNKGDTTDLKSGGWCNRANKDSLLVAVVVQGVNGVFNIRRSNSRLIACRVGDFTPLFCDGPDVCEVSHLGRSVQVSQAACKTSELAKQVGNLAWVLLQVIRSTTGFVVVENNSR